LLCQTRVNVFPINACIVGLVDIGRYRVAFDVLSFAP
jgi:hypothetical protein